MSELAQEVVETGAARLETFGYSDDDAFAAGLTCGGEITVLVRPVTPARDPVFGAVVASVAGGEPVGVATVVDGPAPRGATLAVWPRTAAGRLGTRGLDAAVAADARGELALGVTGLRHYGAARGATRGHRHRVPAVLRAAAAHAGVRRHRLRRRGGPAR